MQNFKPTAKQAQQKKQRRCDWGLGKSCNETETALSKRSSALGGAETRVGDGVKTTYPPIGRWAG